MFQKSRRDGGGERARVDRLEARGSSHAAWAISACAFVLFFASGLARSSEAASNMDVDSSIRCREVVDPLLSRNGKWLVYLSAPCARGAGEVFVVRRSVDGDAQSRYSAGEASLGGGRLKMSPSGRWAAFQIARAAESDAGARMDVAILDVASGALTTHEGVREWDFLFTSREDAATEQIFFQLAARATHESGAELIVQTLSTGSRRTLPEAPVVLSSNPVQSRLAWASPAGLQVYDARTRSVRKLHSGAGTDYRSFTWSRSGNALALLKDDGSGVNLLAFRNVTRGPGLEVDLRRWTTLPQGYTFAAPLQWRDDAKGLFFSVEHPTFSEPATSGVPGLRVWHWKDDHLPGWRQVLGNVSRDWCFLDLRTTAFTRLTDPELAVVEPHSRGRYVVGFDVSRYGWSNKGELLAGGAFRQLRDYYRVDPATGERAPLVAGLKVWTRPGIAIAPTVSPDGTVFLYEDGSGDLIAQDLATRSTRNLTASLPTRFYFPENDPRSDLLIRDSYGQGEPRVQGWSTDGRHVLVSDHYDVWALPLRGGTAMNLTGDGRRNHISYRIALLDPWHLAPGEAPRIDLNAPIYFESFEEQTAREGLRRWKPGPARMESLYSDDARLEFFKSAGSNAYLFSRQTSVESADYFSLGKTWSADRKLTDINPRPAREPVPRPARYLTYQTPAGERHAALHFPVDYVHGRTYPAIVMIYKGQAAGVHTFREPEDEVSQLLSRGYAVLLPDILPRLDQPGRAAVDDVTAGVMAAVASGVVDRERLGLTGHSFGGYETNFIITQSNLFKAAVAFAGLTDLLSSSGSVYEDRWPWSQSDQPYLSAPWWKSWDAYVQNSPLFHAAEVKTPLLLVHGDADGAVDIGQSIELFNALRLMGNRPVVLLEYKGEDHNISTPALFQDFKSRRAAFFDHFLKGAPAPQWWSRGLSLYEGRPPSN